jgi:choline dehydrogenase
MEVAPGGAKDPLWEACFEAATQAGHLENADSNAASAEGVSLHENNIVRGRRQTTADAYLIPAALRTNLKIVADAHVSRLLIEDTACVGVEYNLDGQTATAFADGEVILTAGAIGTPHLLLLSGIGPAEHLRSFGIDVRADIPGVGANLHDHTKSQVSYTTARPVRTRTDARKPLVLTRTDPAAAPDLQMIFIDSPIHPRFAPGPEDGFSVLFSVMTPASRGSLRLAGPAHTRHRSSTRTTLPSKATWTAWSPGCDWHAKSQRQKRSQPCVKPNSFPALKCKPKMRCASTSSAPHRPTSTPSAPAR